jgi:uncharacterized ferritin-like protein (DUF455 family)
MPLMNDLRTELSIIFGLSEPALKVHALKNLWAQRADWLVLEDLALSKCYMGRPDKPSLKPPKQVPSRKPSSLEGLGALIHSVCHIEFNAINLALDAAWRFEHMPKRYYLQWAQVAFEEATHFELLSGLLNDMGFAYGDFDAHEGLWLMCEKTQDDLLARMALVPRTLEARGLDATPVIQDKLKRLTQPLTPYAQRALEILDVILKDEITHVQIGNHWYLWLCAKQGLNPQRTFLELSRTYRAPKIRPPFNEVARRLAGFTDEDLQALNEQAAMD